MSDRDEKYTSADDVVLEMRDGGTTTTRSPFAAPTPAQRQHAQLERARELREASRRLIQAAKHLLAERASERSPHRHAEARAELKAALDADWVGAEDATLRHLGRALILSGTSMEEMTPTPPGPTTSTTTTPEESEATPTPDPATSHTWHPLTVTRHPQDQTLEACACGLMRRWDLHLGTRWKYAERSTLGTVPFVETALRACTRIAPETPST